MLEAIKSPLKDRRQWQRVEGPGTAFWHPVSSTLDVSEAGMAVRSFRRLRLDHVYTFKTRNKASDLELVGLVKWCRKEPKHVGFRFTVGIWFCDGLSREARAVLLENWQRRLR